MDVRLVSGLICAETGKCREQDARERNRLARPPTEENVVRAVGWLVASRWMARGLGIGRTLILSGILLPGDFGRAILVMSIVLFVEAITELRVDYSLIRSRENPDCLYDSAWTIQIMRGFVCGLVIIFCAPLIGRFYEDSLLVAPLYLLSIAVMIGGFVNVGIANFIREMDFRKIFIANVSSRAGALIVSVVFAIVTRSFWAILVGYLVQRLLDVFISYLMHPRRPKFDLISFGEISRHSKWLLLQGILFQILLRADVFLIGKFAGPTALGPYYLAKMIAELIGTEMATALRVALYSNFLRQDHEAGGEGNKLLAFRTLSFSTSLALLIGAPLSILLGLCANDLVHFSLDSQWASAGGFLQLFSINALFGIAAAAPAASILAAGHTRLVALRQAVGLVVFVPALWIGTKSFGLQGAAVAIVLTTMVSASFSLLFSMREVRGDWRAIGGNLFRIAVALMVLCGVALMTLGILPAVSERFNLLHLLRIAAASFASLISYGFVIWFQWYLLGRPDSFERVAFQVFSRILRKLTGRTMGGPPPSGGPG